jgi:hypothetical protein
VISDYNKESCRSDYVKLYEACRFVTFLGHESWVDPPIVLVKSSLEKIFVTFKGSDSVCEAGDAQ